MSLLSMFKGKGPNGYGYGSTAEEVTEGLDLGGRTILLTGCNSGIGHETLRVLSMRGAHVIAAARTREKAEAACGAASGETSAVACELSDPASVLACAETVRGLGRPLDAIVCNAGIMALPKLQQEHGYELSKRFAGTGKTANSVHPGVIHTNLGRSMPAIARAAISLAAPLVLKSIPQGAATQCYLAVHPGAADVTGKYYADCNESRTTRHGRDEALAAKLWEASEAIAAEVAA